jgi:hypothetical protein
MQFEIMKKLTQKYSVVNTYYALFGTLTKLPFVTIQCPLEDLMQLRATICSMFNFI